MWVGLDLGLEYWSVGVWLGLEVGFRLCLSYGESKDEGSKLDP